MKRYLFLIIVVMLHTSVWAAWGEIIYPLGGEIWEQGSTYSVDYFQDWGSLTDLALYDGDDLVMWIFEDHANDMINDNSYSWTIPSSVGISDDFRLFIQEGSGGLGSWASMWSGYFTISGSCGDGICASNEDGSPACADNVTGAFSILPGGCVDVMANLGMECGQTVNFNGLVVINDECPLSCGTCPDCPADCAVDCAGVVGGSAVLSGCDNECNSTKVNDCTGECGGDTVEDCAGECDGDAVEDGCQVCDDNPFNNCVQDCAGEWGGESWESDCGCVSGGNYGNDCDDCAGIPNGDAVIDEYYPDYDGDGWGSFVPESDLCSEDEMVLNETYVTNNWDFDDDCECTLNTLIACLDDCGVCGGNNSTCADCAGTPNGSAVEDCTGLCGGSATGCSVYDIDGNGYTTVTIGTQEWLVQNLKVTHYNNGDEIPTGLNNSSWVETTEGAFAVYDDDHVNADIYGNLYNWHTVEDSRGVCPAGWHVPSDDEYTVLTDYLGGSVGGKMKEAGLDHWNSPNTGATNESGFTGLPAGYRRSNNGSYISMGNLGYFWSSSDNGGGAWKRQLNYVESTVSRTSNANKLNGGSIRCLEGAVDCAGVPNGDSVVDNCDTCDSDSSNDCVQDCAGVWGGDGSSCIGTLLVPSEYSSIQSAIDAASEGDSVLVSAGTYYENITWPETNGIKLIGSGVEDCIIDGYGWASVIRFEYDINGIIDATTLIKGFTVRNGNSKGGENPNNLGGGMYLSNSSPTLTDVTFSDNSADFGGGMYSYISNPTLTNVTFSGNTADNGGGMLLSYADPTLTNVTFSDNLAEDGGGGMSLQFSDPSLTDVTFSSNTADIGGGMYLISSSPALTDVTFSDNSADYGGGGMSLESSSHPTLISVTFSSNTANNGGGMLLSQSDPTLTNVTFSGNTAQYGGGIRLINNSYPTLTDVIFSDNSADYGGGGMSLQDSDPSLTDVTFSGNAAYTGGGMQISFSSATLTGITFSGNTATSSGGGIYIDTSSATLKNSIIWDNSPQSIYISSGDPIITYSNIEGGWEGVGNIDDDPLFCGAQNGDFALVSNSPCVGTGQDGANMGALGVGCEPTDYCSSSNIHCVPSEYSTIQSGINACSNGDRVFVASGTYVENINFIGKNIVVQGADRETTIIDGSNNTLQNGGSVACFINEETNDSKLENFTLTGGTGYRLGNEPGNDATYHYGGGIYCYNSHPTLSNLKLYNNYANASGGGISLNQASPIIENIIIDQNRVNYGAGGALYSYFSSPTIYNALIINNIEDMGPIGGIYVTGGSHLYISNLTSYGNEQIVFGEAGEIITIINSIIWDNGVPPIEFDWEQSSINFSNIKGGWEGEGNIDADPLFIDPENDDYTLQPSSPCIDAGTADLDGDGIDDITDYLGLAPDMGTFEYTDIAGCIDPEACNYDETATIDDDVSCTYPEENYNCDGNCTAGVDCAGECGGTAVLSGCDNACNSTNVEDCAGECGGTAVEDACGVCGGNGSTCNISYSETIQPIFNTNCTGCHGGSGGLYLTSYTSLMESDVVKPGNSVESQLIKKLKGTAGTQMPKGQNPLDDEIINLIASWIDEGACDGVVDCAGVCGGSTVITDCGCGEVASDETTGCCTSGLGPNDGVPDCAGVCGGDAVVDACETCAGSITDATQCDCPVSGEVRDCAGECGGNAVEDECGECDGDGPDESYDCDGNCTEGVDCVGVCGGSAVVDSCGECGGNNSLFCYQDGSLCQEDNWCQTDVCDACNKCGSSNLCIPVINSEPSLDGSIIPLYSNSLNIGFSVDIESESIDAILVESNLLNTSFEYNVEVINDNTLQITLSGLQSADVITLSLDPTLIVAQDGDGLYTMNIVNPDSLSWEYNVSYLGDYNHSGHIDGGLILDSDDIDTLITYWGSTNYQYELGPCLGGPCLSENVPNLIPEFDEIWDIEDVMSFYIMWNGTPPVARSTLSRSQMDNIGEPITLKFEGNTLKMELSESEEIVQHIWFQIWVPINNVTFHSSEFAEEFNIKLNRSSIDESTQEWDLVMLDENNAIDRLILGTFETDTREDQRFEFQYKLTSKAGLISSGSMAFNYKPVPINFVLDKVYPNPFNPMTTIRYALPADVEIDLSVYNIQGRLITNLSSGNYPAGYYETIWNGSQYSSGVYFLKLAAGDYLSTQKLILLK